MVDIVHNKYLSWKLHKCVSPNSLEILEVLPYFKGRLLILASKIRQEKCSFCILVCCTGSAVYLGGRHVKKILKIGLE